VLPVEVEVAPHSHKEVGAAGTAGMGAEERHIEPGILAPGTEDDTVLHLHFVSAGHTLRIIVGSRDPADNLIPD
jgi:hypothetical protein